MIEIKRKGSQVEANIDTGQGWSYFLTWTAPGGEDHATYIVGYMNENMRSKLRIIREQAYNQGWADAKSKKKKRTWFGGWWRD